MNSFLVPFLFTLFVILVSVSPRGADAWNYTTRLNRDRRVAVVLGVFGHSEFGRTEVAVTNLVLEANMRARLAAKVWLELRPVRTASNARKLKQLIEREEADCAEIENTQLDGAEQNAVAPDPTTPPPQLIKSGGNSNSNAPLLKHYLKFVTSQIREEDEDLRSSVTFTTKEAGLYALVYARCISLASTTVSAGALDDKKRKKKRRSVTSEDAPPPTTTATTLAPPAEDDVKNSKRKKKLRVTTSGHFKISQWNPIYTSSSGDIGVGATYLSVGEAPLPTLFGTFALVFAVGSFLWYRDLQKCSEEAKTPTAGVGRPSRIHFAMLIVGVLKACTLLLEAGVYAHRNKTGGTGDMVDIVFVIVAAAKTAILFVIVILLGSGWSISRASLSERERQLIVVVLVVQLVVNIALAVIEEGSPAGSEKVQSWKTWLRVTDLLCALVVLVPIVSRAKSQHDAAAQGGEKARREAQRLSVFRSFYIVTFIFLYFTRIVVPYLESHLPYLMAWAPYLLYELAAVIFYFVATRLFHPASEAWTLPSGGAGSDDGPVGETSAVGDSAHTQPSAAAATAPKQFGVNPNELEELELS